MVCGHELLNISQIPHRDVPLVVGKHATARPGQPDLGGVLRRALDGNMYVNRFAVFASPKEQQLGSKAEQARHIAARPRKQTA